MTLREKLNVRKYVNNIDRGRVIEVFRGDAEFTQILGGVKQVTLITLSPGQEAGSHYHSRKTEVLYIANGWVRGLFHDRASDEHLALHLEAGLKINLLPGVAHLFVNDSDEDVLMMEFSNMAFNLNDQDVQKIEWKASESK